jgi:hypothetical protein
MVTFLQDLSIALSFRRPQLIKGRTPSSIVRTSSDAIRCEAVSSDAPAAVGSDGLEARIFPADIYRHLTDRRCEVNGRGSEIQPAGVAVTASWKASPSRSATENSVTADHGRLTLVTGM